MGARVHTCEEPVECTVELTKLFQSETNQSSQIALQFPSVARTRTVNRLNSYIPGQWHADKLWTLRGDLVRNVGSIYAI